MLGLDSTTTPVDLDQLFDTLDPGTRKSLQQVIQGSPTQYDGKGKNGNEAGRSTSTRRCRPRAAGQPADSDQQACTDLIVDIVAGGHRAGLAARRPLEPGRQRQHDGRRDRLGERALDAGAGALPGTLRQANTTFVNLRSTLDDLDELVDASKPATKRSRRSSSSCARCSRRAADDQGPPHADQPPGRGQRPHRPAAQAPRADKVATPALPAHDRGPAAGHAGAQFIRPYAPDLIGWFRDFGQAAANYDANGHFARISPIVNAFQFTDNPAGGKLDGAAPAERQVGLHRARSAAARARRPRPPPTAPTPTPPSGSDCDPSIVPPGP